MSKSKNIKLITKIITALNAVILIFTWIYTVVTWFQLPDTIAIHFGLDGSPDGYGSRNTNFLLAGINTAMFILLLYLGKNPNAPGLNIPDSLRKKPELTELFVQGILLIIMILFANLSYESTQVSLGRTESLSLFGAYLIGFMFIYMFVFFWVVHRIDRKSMKKDAA